MQLSPQEIQKLELNPPFSTIVWKVGEGRVPQCILKGPDKGELPTFTMIFDNFVLDEKTSKVVTLPFSVASSQRQFSKFGASLFYLEEPEDRGILKCFVQVTEIEVVTCRVVTQGGRKKRPIQKSLIPVSIRRQGWQSRNRQEVQEVLKRHQSGTRPKTIKSQPANGATQAHSILPQYDKKTLLGLPLIGRCIFQQRLLAQRLYKPVGEVTRKAFWCKLLPFALEKSRKFIVDANASQLIEQKRRVYNGGHRPVNPPSFLAPHLWFEFDRPVRTGVCPDTAALFVFSHSDTNLIASFARHEKDFPQNLQALYLPERNRFSLSVINTNGEIVWAMSLPSTEQYAHENTQAWLVPAWYACNHTHNHIVASELSSDDNTSSLCNDCKEAQVYFSTWLLVICQALQGLYREHNIEVDKTVFDRIGVQRISIYKKKEKIFHTTHRYHVLRYTDISAVFKRPLPQEPLNPRGSWVKALEPDQVGYEKREIPLMTRTLRAQRYTDGNRERGTNQIEVRPHIRHIPVRTDQEKITKITAKHYPKKKGRG